MRYAAIRSLDVTNGEGTGVSLFVQGCPFHCYQCFNPETWSFDGGKEWTDETEERFIELAGRNYIKRISFLGGSPLCDMNVKEVSQIIKRMKRCYQNKMIWVYTGMTWEEINLPIDNKEATLIRKELLNYIDILVEGRFEYDKRDFALKFRGSSNQRIINVPKSLETGHIVLYYEDN